MDRNTLLAFFLIALVLLFTPKYMEIFGPPQTAKENLTTQNTGESQADTLARLNTGAMVNNKTPETTFLKDRENEHIVKTVEMDLYTVKVSSVNGGSIQEFLLKEFLAPDSQEVNTIARNSKSNLLIDLQRPKRRPNKPRWELGSCRRTDMVKARFRTNLKIQPRGFSNKKINKSLVFIPKTYTVEIQFDFSEIKDMIYRDVRFSWRGGLATTEKDSIDDKTYFKAIVSQGKELEDLKVKDGDRESKTNWLYGLGSD